MSCVVTYNEVDYELELLDMTVDGLPACKQDDHQLFDDTTRNITVQAEGGENDFIVVHAWPSLGFLLPIKDNPAAASFPDCWKFTGGDPFSDTTGNYKRKVSLSTPGVTTFELKINQKLVKSVVITVVKIGELTLTKDMVAAGSTTTIIETPPTLEPAGRTLAYSVRCNRDENCFLFDDTDLVAGNTGQTVVIRAADSAFPSCYVEKTVDIAQLWSAGFDKVSAKVGGSAKASVGMYPGDLDVSWSITSEDKLGCSISGDGVLSTGSKTGNIAVKALATVDGHELSAYTSIEICSKCMDEPVGIGSIEFVDNKTVYCLNNNETSGQIRIKLTGYCCGGQEYAKDREIIQYIATNNAGKYPHNVVSVTPEGCGTIQGVIPPYTVESLDEIKFCPSSIVHKTDYLVSMRLDACPDGTEVDWEITDANGTKRSSFSNGRHKNEIIFDTKWDRQPYNIKATSKKNSKCSVSGTLIFADLEDCSPCAKKVVLLNSCKNKKDVQDGITLDGYLLGGIPVIGPTGNVQPGCSAGVCSSNSGSGSGTSGVSSDLQGTTVPGGGVVSQFDNGDIILESGGSATVFSYNSTTGQYTSSDTSSIISVSDTEIRITSADGSVTVFYGLGADLEFAGKLKYSTDRYGQTNTFTWDTIGGEVRIVAITDSFSRVTSYSYDDSATGDYLLSEIVDPQGRSQKFQYDEDSRLVATVMPAITKAAEGNTFPGGTGYVYQYDTTNIRPERRNDLLAVWYPNEVAPFIDVETRTIDVARVYREAVPRERYVYGQDPSDENHYGKVIHKMSGDPSSGSMTRYRYVSDADEMPDNIIDPSMPIVRRTIVTDANGNETIYDFNTYGLLARQEVLANRDKLTVDGETLAESYVTWTRYNSRYQPLLEVYPAGNSVEYKYEDATTVPVINGSPWALRIGLLRSRTEKIGNTLGIPSRANPEGWTQTMSTTSYFYDPLFSQTFATVDPRGNAINENGDYFTPQNGGPVPSDTDKSRYASFNYFDYQKNALATVSGDADIQNILGLTAAQVEELIGAVSDDMIARGLPDGFKMGLGDINGDGSGNGDGNGGIVYSALPAYNLGNVVMSVSPGEVQTDGSIVRPQEYSTVNHRGQTTTHVDAAGSLTIYVRYPESDPEGDGKLLAPALSNKQYGLLREVHVDADPADVMRLVGADGDIDSFDASKIIRLATGDYLDLVTRYTSTGGCSSCGYDALGNVLSETDPRGFTTLNERNELGEVYRRTTAAPYTFVSETFYDANRNVIREDTEDWTVDYDCNDPNNAAYAHITPCTNDVGSVANLKVKRGPGGKLRSGWFTNLYEYDLLDRRVSEDIDATGSETDSIVTSYEYDGNGNLIKTTDPLGIISEYDYDERNMQIAQRTDGVLTGVTVYNVDGSMHMQLGAKTRGGVTCNATVTIADAFFSGSSLTHSGVITAENVYDGFGRLVKTIDAAGGSSESHYDPLGRLIQSDLKGSIGQSDLFDVEGEFINATPADRSGNGNTLLSSSIVRYDDMGRQYESEQSVFIATGTVLPSGRSVTHTGGGLARLGSTAHIDQAVLTSGQTSYVISRNVYDIAGRLVKTIADNGGETTYEYDGAGRTFRVTDPDGNTVENTYDANGNVILSKRTEKCTAITVGDDEIAPEVFLSATKYDCINRPVIFASQGPDGLLNTDPSAAGNQTIFTYAGYDSRGNTVLAVDPKGNTSLNIYDAAGRVLESHRHMRVDGNGANGPLDDSTFLAGADATIRTTFVYNAAGQLLRQTDDTGAITSYEYDSFGRQVKMKFHDGSNRTWNYDVADLLSYIDEASNTFTYTYDVLGRRIEVDINKVSNFAGTTWQGFQFDGAGRTTCSVDRDTDGDAITRFRYDSLSRLLEESQTFDGHTRNVTTAGFMSYAQQELVYPDGRMIYTDHDTLFRLWSIREGAGSSLPIADFEYFGPGRLAEVTLGNGLCMTMYNNARTGSAVQPSRALPAWGNNSSDRLGYDGAGRLICKRYIPAELSGNAYVTTTAKAAFTTKYDAAGNKLFERNIHKENSSFLYDGLDSINRLRNYQCGTLADGGQAISTVTTTGKYESQNWQLDSVGNWLKLADKPTGASAVEQDRIHNKLHQIIAVDDNDYYDYDGNGNLVTDGTKTFVWDAFNRLLLANNGYTGGSVEFRYDANGRRLRKTVVASAETVSSTDYIYSGMQCLEERNASTDAMTKQYVWGLYVDELLQIKLSDGTKYYPLQDLLYRTSVLTDSNRNIVESYEYTPYGMTTVYDSEGTVKTTNPICEYLFTGRQLDPETGLYYYRARYYSPELGRFISKDPLGYQDGMNLYEYVKSNPLKYTDLTGLASCCGPDVTDSLRTLMTQVENDWKGWDWWEKNRRCNGMLGAGGWDVRQLAARIVREKGCGTGECKGTVRAYDGCHDAAQVNYILWGKMNRLCGNSLKGSIAIVVAWKLWQYGHYNSEAIQWTAIGYGGIGKYTIGLLGSIFNDKKECGNCGKKSNVKFTYHWSRDGNAWVRIPY